MYAYCNVSGLFALLLSIIINFVMTEYKMLFCAQMQIVCQKQSLKEFDRCYRFCPNTGTS